MTPPRRNQRLGLFIASALALVAGVTLLLSALGENTQFFYNPSDIASETFVAESSTIRVGGLVIEGSVIKGTGLTTQFQLGDFEGDNPALLTVTYSGVLPDLFREGQGIVVTGELSGPQALTATNVLAKHDENYRPQI